MPHLQSLFFQHENNGDIFFHPNDDRDLISGYSTIARELLDQTVDTPVDIVLVCCGGGGLLAGVSAGLRAWGRRNPAMRIYGVEPEHACGMYLSVGGGAAVD